MKHKICFLVGVLFLNACGVELKDKEKAPQVVALAKPDYVIDEPLVLKEHTTLEVDRLVLTKNALIITEDKNLMINAKELVSEGAVIRNFAEGQRAFWEAQGRNGGNITITVHHGSGNLQVLLKGEDGGPGKHGLAIDHHPGCSGTSGANGGNSGSLVATIVDNNGFNLSYQNDISLAGPAGVKGKVFWGTPNAVYPPCVDDAPNGIDGKPGSKGQVCFKLGGEETFRCE